LDVAFAGSSLALAAHSNRRTTAFRRTSGATEGARGHCCASRGGSAGGSCCDSTSSSESACGCSSTGIGLRCACRPSASCCRTGQNRSSGAEETWQAAQESRCSCCYHDCRRPSIHCDCSHRGHCCFSCSGFRCSRAECPCCRCARSSRYYRRRPKCSSCCGSDRSCDGEQNSPSAEEARQTSEGSSCCFGDCCCHSTCCGDCGHCRGCYSYHCDSHRCSTRCPSACIIRLACIHSRHSPCHCSRICPHGAERHSSCCVGCGSHCRSRIHTHTRATGDEHQ
jgi:hypothetical protein